MSGTSAGASRAARIALRAAAVLMLGTSGGAAMAGAGAYGWPVWWGAGVVYPWYFNAGGCLPGGPCAAWAWQDRRPFKRPIAPEPLVFDDQDIWGSSGSPWGYVQRLPPPTPQSQIQPQYRDASTIRPEFDRQP